tara:strand:- start:92 stop:511 length:420 start_codon:yes stop_codon:yes gene_type:complete
MAGGACVTGGEHDTNAKQLAIIASATQDLFVLGVLIASLRGGDQSMGIRVSEISVTVGLSEPVSLAIQTSTVFVLARLITFCTVIESSWLLFKNVWLTSEVEMVAPFRPSRAETVTVPEAPLLTVITAVTKKFDVTEPP